jgi:predicted extracellular nuclease
MTSSFLRVSCLSVLFATMFAGGAEAVTASAHLVISQVYGGGGNSGSTYKNDFIEIYNPGASAVNVNGWSVQYTSATGTAWQVTNLANTSIQPGHYFLIQEAVGAGGTTNLPTPDTTGTIQLSATAGRVALVNTTTALGSTCAPIGGTVVDYIGFGTTANCYEGTGPAPAPSNTTADIRKLNGSNVPIDTDSNPTDFQTGAPVPHNSTYSVSPLSITQLSPSSAIAGSADTNVTITGMGFGSDSLVNFTGQSALTPAPANIASTSILVTIPAAYLASVGTPSVSVSSGGLTSNGLTFTVSSANPTCTETNTIAQLQGTGDKSAYVSTTTSYTSQGIVTYKKSNGFFMQMAVGDGDPNTSDAIYVFTSSAPAVSLGDLACVTGKISEYYNGGTVDTTDPENTLTEYAASSVVVISSGNALPAPITLTPNASGTYDQLEKYESMRVTISSLTVTGPGGVSAVGTTAEANGTYNPSGAFWGIVTGTPLPFRQPGIEVSHPIVVENSTGASYGLLKGTEPLFDGNPERIQVYTGGPGSTVIDVSDGAVVTNLTGPLDVYYGDFELDEDAATTPGYIAPSVSNNTLTFTAVPQGLSSELTIGTYNLEHFYDDVANKEPGEGGEPFEVVLATSVYQGRLAKASMAIRNVLHTPDVLGVQEAENIATLQALAAKIGSDAVAAGQTNPNYTPYLYVGNDPSGINVGFLVNTNRISNVSTTQYFRTDTYTGTTLTFDRPPVLLTGYARNGTGAPLPFAVLNNHLKALPDDDPTSPSSRLKKQAQAQEMAQFIQSLQVANPGIVLAVLGDLNSFEFSDGIIDVVGTLIGNPAPASAVVLSTTNVVSPALTEMSGTTFLPLAQKYSYVESGNAQQLDHILVSTNLYSRVTQFAIGRVDADFTQSLHYDFTRPERLSDHDPEVVYLRLPAAAEVTSSVSFTLSGLAFNRGTQLYNGTVTVKNTSVSSIGGPLQLFFNGLPSGVTLANATAKQGGVLPYITSTGSLAPGASVSIPVQFQVQSGATVSYTNTLFTGSLQ